ncbi:hypothetical protein EDB89DRAFT_1908364 [Lactarius sanguifluus]|nr:hypothetical protein EDB89DRAFT_1908364 [Lactarius sanguifluus]
MQSPWHNNDGIGHHGAAMTTRVMAGWKVNEPGEGYGLTTSSLASLLTTVLLMQVLLALVSPFALNSATMITQSITAILQPHTSSPSLLVVSHAVASLMATNLGGSGLDQVLSAHLDSLAILPQAKQAIIPALLGMAKFTEMHTQAQRFLYFCALSSVTQPQAVIEPPSSNSSVASATSSGSAHTGYQIIGCLALVDNGKAFPEMQNAPSTMTGSFPFVAMGNQAGLREQQSAQWKLEGRRERSHN